MCIEFLTNVSKEQFKEFLRDAMREVMDGKLPLQEKPPDILDAVQAAQFLKMKPATLYEKTSKKVIPHFKKGNRLYFHLSELQQWIGQGKVKTGEEIKREAITFTLNKKAA